MADQSQTPSNADKKRQSAVASIAETLESIIVAFILAFIFRAFIVEAFVIPTGSMASTLYGAQVTQTCSTCGFEYARGITTTDVARLQNGASRTVTLACPNCDTMTDDLSTAQILRPDSGDRILVHKWPFDVGGELLGPKRWDVTVFKDPRDGETNFIKRLIGLPGELLEIIDGDVYAAPLDTIRAADPSLVDEFDQLRKTVYHYAQDNLNIDPDQIQAQYAKLNQRLLPYLEIQQKTELAQQSLWHNVYNHDFLPNYDHLHDRSGPRVRWEPLPEGSPDSSAAKAWDTSQREITFASDDAEPLYIQFMGKQINDFSAYNTMNMGGPNGSAYQQLGDIRLQFTWVPQSGNGSISMIMNRDQDVLQATIGLDGLVKLQRQGPTVDAPGGRQLIGQKKLKPFVPHQAVRIEFVNVDYRVSITVDGEEVLASINEQYAPDLPRRLALSYTGGPSPIPSYVRIGARNMQCRLRHLAIYRDVYYSSPRQCEGLSTAKRGERNAFLNWPGWGTAGMPILLRDNGAREYFMLGDNSPASKDSRLWWEIGPHLEYLGEQYQVATVCEDQLIGKAFFVYWPAGFKPSWSAGIGVIPNVGRMRWIR